MGDSGSPPACWTPPRSVRGQRHYGMWSRELPVDLPGSVVAARAAGRAIALSEHRLGWDYAVLDVPALRAHLADQLSGVQIHAGRAVGSPETGVVAVADGSQLRASVVIDAGGQARPLTRRRRVGCLPHRPPMG